MTDQEIKTLLFPDKEAMEQYIGSLRNIAPILAAHKIGMIPRGFVGMAITIAVKAGLSEEAGVWVTDNLTTIVKEV